MSNYKQTKQYIDGVTKQKNNTEARCANQRQQLALMNAQIKNYKELLKECKDYIGDGCLSLQECRNVINKIDNAIGEK